MKTEIINNQIFSREGFLLTGLESEEISYLQANADLVGPNREMNKRLRSKATSMENWKHTISKTDFNAISITQIENITLPENCIEVFRKISVPNIDIAKLIWKWHYINQVFDLPNDSRVLCIGANPGLECLVAQNLFPNWRITGVDFSLSDKILFGNLLEMNIADIGEVFSPDSFDLCFSNHVLEHLGPVRERVLKSVSKVLCKDGYFASAMPCDANPKNPPINNFLKIIENGNPKQMHLMNPAHMWKTDIFDIYDVLSINGFKEIKFFHFKGSGADNHREIYKQVPKELVMQENTVKPSIPNKLMSVFNHFNKLPDLSDLALRLHYISLRRNFEDHNLIPEILFCCRSGK
ncbi:class I SAM-dependent methyltransferase [Adhaeribacter radiodurans]|uniref:Class I SAM-dependent methyltransferase n=1 Tax=Adhaeribacter radiodurans TaxID=2745197 RepID=A0A7L7L3S3_9BACT|nr:class I SAM-dependent methyltransferase [Adhaeribacter radiodurans]QMU27424.1 class I SAM-dependent methyltransferase [Adhaeribacter radiodurans]